MARQVWGLLLLGLWLLVGLVHPVQAVPGADLHPLVQQLFPKATRIDEPLVEFPVVPVYQLNELLGYVFESRDLNDLPGFSGKPIKLLIGIDTQGRFSGVKVLDHHEPVFLHGLGQDALFAFVEQYRGRSVAEQIIIANGRKEDSGQGVAFIDGVTKATVSVIIINDTILSSALQVARRQLESFVQASAAEPKADYFEPLSWGQLLERGWLKHWRVPLVQVEQVLGRSLDSYPSWEGLNPEAPFAEFFYAYLNVPSIGRNLLGDNGFARLKASLKPGEQVFAVLATGPFDHQGEGFKPGTVPERLGLIQHGLSVELRDLNMSSEIPLLAPGLAGNEPPAGVYSLLRIKAQAGFNPAAPMQLALNLQLARNPLLHDRAQLLDDYQLPDRLFEPIVVAPIETPPPLWLSLWQQRAGSVFILGVALILLTWAFVRQQWLIERPQLFYPFRWGFLLFTFGWLGLYAQGQLSVVNIYTLLLNLLDGFDITLYLLDPVIFILWSFTFISLLIWGRGLFCGWLCPFGALQEMLNWIALKMKLRQWRIRSGWHQRLIYLKYLVLLLLVGVAFVSLTLAERLAEVEPFKTSITLGFVREWPFLLYALLLLGVGLFVHKFYCRYLCPLGAGMAVLGRLRRVEWLRRVELCGKPCQLCHRACGIHAIRRDGRIDYDECIQCLECVLILQDPQRCVAQLQQAKQSGIIANDAGGNRYASPSVATLISADRMVK